MLFHMSNAASGERPEHDPAAFDGDPAMLAAQEVFLAAVTEAAGMGPLSLSAMGRVLAIFQAGRTVEEAAQYLKDCWIPAPELPPITVSENSRGRAWMSRSLTAVSRQRGPHT